MERIYIVFTIAQMLFSFVVMRLTWLIYIRQKK